MGVHLVVHCDGECGRKESAWVPDITALNVNNWVAQSDWKVQEKLGKPYYLCPVCQNGRSREEVLLIKGGVSMLEAMRGFDNESDCYATSCLEEAHGPEGCLIHVYQDDDADMDGPYVMIISSGCGSYHAEMRDSDGNVLLPTGNEIWFEL